MRLRLVAISAFFLCAAMPLMSVLSHRLKLLKIKSEIKTQLLMSMVGKRAEDCIAHLSYKLYKSNFLGSSYILLMGNLENS